MDLDSVVDSLRLLTSANDISVISDGGYCYLVLDEKGHTLSPSQLGMNLAIQGGKYCRVDSNVYQRTATIRPSNDVGDKNNVKHVHMSKDRKSAILTGDIH